jgi:small subunit ribosomal protein S6
MARLESLADAPGTSREYETIYVLRPTVSNEGVAEVNTRVRGIIEGLGGKVINVDNWGKRRLAYEVAGERKGIYLYWQYLGSAGVVAEFERNMRMLDTVVRYMTVKLDADIDPEARPTQADDETYERAANTAADEEDVMLGHVKRSPDDDDDDDDSYGDDSYRGGRGRGGDDDDDDDDRPSRRDTSDDGDKDGE